MAVVRVRVTVRVRVRVRVRARVRVTDVIEGDELWLWPFPPRPFGTG